MITQYPEIGSKSNPSSVDFADSLHLDAFSRLRISEPVTLFDSQQEYGLDTRTTWDCAANGTLSTASSNGSAVSGSNSVGPRDVNTRMVPIVVSTTSGHYSVLQSRQYVRYAPGKSQLILITGIFSPGTIPNCDARTGYFDSANGIFLKVTNGVYSVVRRTSTSGSVVDNEVLQSAWNIDKLDGTGVSGKTLDLTKTNILVIDAQWLGIGRVRIGFDIDGVIVPVHQFLNANVMLVPYTQTFNLPVRLELRNTGTSSGTPTIQFVCCSVQSEGGTDIRGFPQTASNGVTAIGVTTRRPVLSIRPKATYNSITNRSHIEASDFAVIAKTNDCYYEIVVGGTLTGASWTSVNATSATEYDVAATAISGGISIISDFVLSGSGSVRGKTEANADVRNPLTISQIDALTAFQTPISIVATSVSGTSNIQASLNWHEKTI